MPLAVGMFVVLGLWWIVLLGITPSKAYFGALFDLFMPTSIDMSSPGMYTTWRKKHVCTISGFQSSILWRYPNGCIFCLTLEASLIFDGQSLSHRNFSTYHHYHPLSSTIINSRHHDHHFHHYHCQSLSSLYIISFTPLCYCITIRDQYPFRMDADGNPTRRQHWATDWMGRN